MNYCLYRVILFVYNKIKYKVNHLIIANEFVFIPKMHEQV